jgi:hypothetical protein
MKTIHIASPIIEVYVPLEQKEEALKIVEKFYANYSEKSKNPENSSPQNSCGLKNCKVCA